MTSDDIIRMALEQFGAVLKPSDLEVKLAVLAVEAEREACELIVDNLIISGSVSEVQQRRNWAYMHARDAIRARGEA